MTANEEIFSQLHESRRRFLALVDELRPDLHRYCTRMTGSPIDGEDVVQDTLARAYYELAELKEMPALRPWLFRIAHNRAIDYLRSYERRMSEPLDTILDVPADETLQPDNAVARNDAVRAAVSRFSELAPVQRSCVILKDVFDYSVEEIAGMLDLSVPATKSALARGRTKLRDVAASVASQEPNAQQRPVSQVVARYAELFNLRDWDSVRAMLVDEVKLELVSRLKRVGRHQVSSYFSNYESISGWRLIPGRLEGREVLSVFLDPRKAQPSYFIELTLKGDRVAVIRDFRYVPYVMREGPIELAVSTPFPAKAPQDSDS
jgi:RNA polymerase sigma-70 factor (ECF subfamily)